MGLSQPGGETQGSVCAGRGEEQGPGAGRAWKKRCAGGAWEHEQVELMRQTVTGLQGPVGSIPQLTPASRHHT